eukprot:Awhi_evm2s13340
MLNTETQESKITQLDCVVFDVSSSMNSRSKLDIDKTRLDVSKILFHTMVDKLYCFELEHKLALVTFGKKIENELFTTEYE